MATAAISAVACDKPGDVAVSSPTTAPVAGTGTAAPLWRPATRPEVFDVGDLLEVRIDDLSAAGVPSLGPARVAADGTLPVQLVGPMPVAGRTADEVRRDVADAFRKANIIMSANVDVLRLQVAGTGSVGVGPIGNYDLVRCSLPDIFGNNTERVTVRRVNGRGELAVPLVGPVKVAGLTDAGAAAAINAAFQKAAVANNAHVTVLTLERAPADAEHKALPDGPIDPVPEAVRFLYEVR